jgi:hypothetical protein
MVPTPCRSDFPSPGSPFVPCCGDQDSATTDGVRHLVRESSIGVVVFLTHKRKQAEAILDIEGVWRCPKLPVLDRVLNAFHEPRRRPGAVVPFGHAELIRVAAWLKGVVSFHRSRTDIDGRYGEPGWRAGHES